MIGFFLSWLVSAVVLVAVAYLLPGITLAGFTSALIAALVLGLFNGIVGPILKLLTLPLNFLTLGLFSFVINAIGLLVASNLVNGFGVDGFGSAFIGALIIALANSVVGMLGAKSFA